MQAVNNLMGLNQKIVHGTWPVQDSDSVLFAGASLRLYIEGACC